jgi:transcriptional regulator with XRE-family HTH domain
MEDLLIFELSDHAICDRIAVDRRFGCAYGERVGTARTFVPSLSLPHRRGATAMSLAQRVRDFRYSKGWGPDELANRAEISRTALYQIESGKTELPRAGTLRRIAVALNVPMEDLLGQDHLADAISSAADYSASHRSRQEWIPEEGGPLAVPGTSNFKSHSTGDENGGSRLAVHAALHSRTNSHDALYLREGALMAKLHDLIHSPMGDGVAVLVEELHALILRSRSSI